MEHFKYTDCTEKDLCGFSVIAAEKHDDNCTLYGFYPWESSDRYLIVILEDYDGCFSMMIAKVEDE